METVFAFPSSEDVQLLGASNGDAEYILWQYTDERNEPVYFEWDDQANGGYDNVLECTVDMDGCHIAIRAGHIVHFYWNPPRHRDLKRFVDGLRAIYGKTTNTLEVHDYRN